MIRFAWSIALAVAAVWFCSWFSWAIMGDSVSFDARQEIGERNGYFRGFGGVAIPVARPGLRRLARSGYEELLIEVGLNDVSAQVPVPELRFRIRAALQDVRGVACVLWTDLDLSSNVHRDWPRRAREFNRVLREEVTPRGVTVAAWSRASARHPRWFRPDGLHLNPAGQIGYARWARNQVAQACR